MPANVPASLTRLEVRQLFAMRLNVSIVQKIGGQAVAQVGVITGGSFDGDRLSGKILDGGSDWQTIRADVAFCSTAGWCWRPLTETELP